MKHAWLIHPTIPSPAAGTETPEVQRILDSYLEIDTSPAATSGRCQELLHDFVMAMAREGVNVLALTVDQHVFPGNVYNHQVGQTKITVEP